MDSQYARRFGKRDEAIGQPMKTYVPGLAEVIGNDLETSAEFHYLTHDHLGSTRGMWDRSRKKLGTWEYTPYGAPFHFAGPPDVTQLYTGHDYDPATGQYYAPFRYLDPTIGRWLKQDPLRMIDGTNMYGYVGGNPVNTVDQYGLTGCLGWPCWSPQPPLEPVSCPAGSGPPIDPNDAAAFAHTMLNSATPSKGLIPTLFAPFLDALNSALTGMQVVATAYGDPNIRERRNDQIRFFDEYLNGANTPSGQHRPSEADRPFDNDPNFRLP